MNGLHPDIPVLIAILAGAVSGLIALYFFYMDLRAVDEARREGYNDGRKAERRDELKEKMLHPLDPDAEARGSLVFELIRKERERRALKPSRTVTVPQALMHIDITIAGINDRGGEADPKALQAFVSLAVTCIEAATSIAPQKHLS